MAIPQGENAFTWAKKQTYDLSLALARLNVYYENWSDLTAGQKTVVRNRASTVLGTVITELQAVRDAVDGL